LLLLQLHNKPLNVWVPPIVDFSIDMRGFLAVTSRGMKGLSMSIAIHTSVSTVDPRSRVFVHRIQKNDAAWIELLLLLYSVLLFIMAFYGAYLRPVVVLYTSDSFG